MKLIYNILLGGIICLVAHEGGHFLCALVTGCRPSIGIVGWRVVVSYTWNERWKYRLISEAGFGCEFLMGLALLVLLGTPGAWVDKQFLICYGAITAAHFWAYSWYAGTVANDFDGLCSHVKEAKPDGEIL